MQNRHGPGVIFDDHFRARTHTGHQRGELARYFRFRDVDNILGHKWIIHRDSSSLDDRGAPRTLRTAHPITSSLSDAAWAYCLPSLPALHSTEAAFCRLRAPTFVLFGFFLDFRVESGEEICAK